MPHVVLMRRVPFGYRRDPAVPAFPDDKPIIIFDGYCSLCSGMASFVLRHDKARRFRLLTAQSALGQALYLHYGLDPRDYETNILIKDGTALFKSGASIRIFTGLGWPWRVASVFMIVPRPVRDWLYDRVARSRLRLFGKRSTCYMPERENADRFLG